MSNKQVRWAPVNRAKGESMDHWLRRCRDAHQAAYIQAKIARGEWLPKEEYERLTGRPGRTLTTSQEIEAEIQRHRGPNLGGTPGHEDTSLVSPDTVLPGETAALGDVAWDAGKSALWSAVISAAFCAGKHVVQREEHPSPAVVDVMKTALKEGGRRGAIKLTEATIEEGLRRLAAARAATALAKEAAQAAAEQAGKAALREAGKNVAKEAGVVIAREGGKQIAKEAAKQVAQQTAKQAMVATLRGNAIGGAATLIVDQVVDTVRLAAGSIDGKEYGKRTAENVGSAAGGLGGTAAGAAIGTLVFPGAGTVVGAFVGGFLGSLALTSGVRKLVR